VTRRVALLGKPLKRRHSQVMHDAAFDAAGIDARYVLLELEPDEVEPAVAAARGEGWLGLGVTAPYKQVVPALVDEVEADAATIGAVNTVVRTDGGRLIGINTDAPGFRAGVELAMGRALAGREVVVVGAGGVAPAVVYACLQAGVLRLTVANRNPDRARTLLQRFDREGEASRRTTGLDSDSSFHDVLFTADLVVNATTVGMIDPGVPFPVDRMGDRATVFDCVYVPAETPLVAAARARGLRAANGSEMLIQQAAIAFERWTGVAGMADVMRAAVAALFADAGAGA
jgi:shikimate dehydrogenase